MIPLSSLVLSLFLFLMRIFRSRGIGLVLLLLDLVGEFRDCMFIYLHKFVEYLSDGEVRKEMIPVCLKNNHVNRVPVCFSTSQI